MALIDRPAPARHRRASSTGCRRTSRPTSTASADFDGTHLYEHADPRQGFHPDWTVGDLQLRPPRGARFLVSSAMCWLDRYHADGLRVDAVASMLYLDYSRKRGRVDPERVRRPGEPRRDRLPAPAQRGASTASSPDVQTIAEESTAWPMVSPPDLRRRPRLRATSGTWAGCTTRSQYLRRRPGPPRASTTASSRSARLRLQRELRAAALPRRGRARQGLAAGQDAGRRLAAARQPAPALRDAVDAARARSCCSWAASWPAVREWDHEGTLDWSLHDAPEHAGVRRLVADLNRLLPRPSRRCTAATATPPASGGSTPTTPTRACSPSCASIPTARPRPVAGRRQRHAVARHNYRLGVPAPGAWLELLNTDAELLRRQRRRQPRRGRARCRSTRTATTSRSC